MFKETYKAANDDIKAGEELLDKVLSQKPRKRPPVYKYSSIAAAAVVICVGLASIPMMNGIRHDTQDAVTATNPPSASNAETEKKQDNSVNLDKGAAKEENQTRESGYEPEAKRQERNIAKAPLQPNNAVSDNKKSETVKEVPQSKHEEKPQKQNAAEQNEPRELNEDTVKKAIIAEDMTEVKKVDTYTRYVVLHANSVDYGMSGAENAGTYNAYDSGSEYKTEEWTMDDYFEYLGENVFEKVSLPPDFNYIGEYNMTVSVDENGKPGFDSQIFPYEGENDRYVTVITSKNTASADSYIEDERYQKSDVCGTDAVVIGGEEEYKSYIVSNDVSHIVTSNGITEDELGDLLVSIGGNDE